MVHNKDIRFLGRGNPLGVSLTETFPDDRGGSMKTETFPDDRGGSMKREAGGGKG